MENSRFIKSIGTAVANNGMSVGLDLGTLDGERKVFFSNIETLQRIIVTLIAASQEAANNLSPDDMQAQFKASDGPRTVLPIDVAQFQVGQGRSKDEILVDLHLGLIHLTFAAHRSQAEALIDQIRSAMG
jgi:hypothetical protein